MEIGNCSSIFLNNDNYCHGEFLFKQECISVGCIPSAAVAVGGGGVCPGGLCLPGYGVSAPVHAGIHTNITFPQLCCGR